MTLPSDADLPGTFGNVADQYALARPGYPGALFAWLAEQAPATDVAWDCAAGSGQASVGLADHFARVIATDASEAQIQQATAHPRIEFRVAGAEASGLPDASVDLVTVAQALHWLPLEPFYSEVRRVSRRGGVIAVWTYHWLTTGDADIDAIVDELALQTLSGYWPAGREHVDNEYADLAFPFDRLDVPEFEMSEPWTPGRLATYLRSWSATARYVAETGVDPVSDVERRISNYWAANEAREVRWPLTVLAGRAA